MGCVGLAWADCLWGGCAVTDQYASLELGNDDPGMYGEIGRLMALYVRGRAMFGEETNVNELREALLRIVKDIDRQLPGLVQ